MNWHKWVGKKHIVGADPTCDEGCDCLLMVVRIREALGLSVPSKEKIHALIELAKQFRHDEIYEQITPNLVPIEGPSEGGFTVFSSLDHIGTAVMIGGGLLHVDIKRGVRWLPASALRKFSWFHWK
jgi:hypothetical protein